MTDTRFSILGPLEVRRGDQSVALGGVKPRTVLAALLLEANHAVSKDFLVDVLWGDDPPEKARNTLHAHVKNLRNAVGRSSIVARPPGYLIEVDAGSFDLSEFRASVARARDASRHGRLDEASVLLTEALRLWRGNPLADLPQPSDGWLHGRALRLEEERRAALEERFDVELARGVHAEVVGELQELVDAEPLWERLRGQHMLALYRCGRHADALRSYQSFRRELAEAGVEPPEQLRDLEHLILAQAPKLAWRPLLEDPEPPSTAVGPDVRGGRAALVAPDGRILTLEGGSYTVGRHPGAALVLDEPNVSRTHARIRATSRGFLLVDVSRNGTAVNGELVDERLLVDGDVIRIGHTDLRFTAEAAELPASL